MESKTLYIIINRSNLKTLTHYTNPNEVAGFLASRNLAKNYIVLKVFGDDVKVIKHKWSGVGCSWSNWFVEELERA